MLTVDRYTGRSLVAFQSCGCWSAVQVEYSDVTEQTREASRFLAETATHGVVRWEYLHGHQFQSLRNGRNNDLTHGCDHDPKWGGDPSTHRDCPRCWKPVLLTSTGRLRAHMDGGRSCSQQPWASVSDGAAP